MKVWATDYFVDFACKCGTCRNCCCVGWDVGVPMQEYFNLLGLDCSPQLRNRLDRGFTFASSPSPDRYALINHDFTGNCPLRENSGLCALQNECGVDSLPSICRVYPRSVKNGGRIEACCANSCEAVIEKLISRGQLTFVSAEIDDKTSPLLLPNLPQQSQIVREKCIALVQDRTQPLGKRMNVLGMFLRILSDSKTSVTDALKSLNGKDYVKGFNAFFTQLRLMQQLGGNSVSVLQYAQNAFVRFGLNVYVPVCIKSARQAYKQYEQALRNLYALVPQIEDKVENVLVNHMFYEQFPYADSNLSVYDEYKALCVVYSFVKFLLVGNVLTGTDNEIADILSGLFRLVEHTHFDKNSNVVLNNLLLNYVPA